MTAALTLPARVFRCFFSVTFGHSISETFTGTGLVTATGLDMSFNVVSHSLADPINWER